MQENNKTYKNYKENKQIIIKNLNYGVQYLNTE